MAQVASGPWNRAGVDPETWRDAHTRAVALRETTRLTLAAADDNEASPDDHDLLCAYADILVRAVEHGDPEIVAMLLRRASRQAITRSRSDFEAS